MSVDTSVLLAVVRKARQAEAELVERYAPYVRSRIDTWFSVPSSLREDAHQEGMIALLTAARTKSDDAANKRCSFETYLNRLVFGRVASLLAKQRRYNSTHLRLKPDMVCGVDAEAPFISLDGLSERERTVLTWRFGLDGNRPRSLQRIGSELGLTDSRVCQIEAKALARLRGDPEEAEEEISTKCTENGDFI